MKTIFRKHLYFLLCCVSFIFVFEGCSGSSTVVDNKNTITGIIYDKSGKPAKSARVVMRLRDYLPQVPCLCKRRSTPADGIYTTITDNHGQFSFNSLYEGVFCIEAISNDKKLRLLIDRIVVDHEFLESNTWINIDTPRYDTKLKPPCTIKGIIIPAGDTVSGTVRVFGLDVYTSIKSDGSFILDNLPQGTLRLKIATNQSGNVHDDTLTVSIIDTTGNPDAEGLKTLLRIVPETAGSNCEAGGWKEETGLDINGNDTLEDTEVTTTNYSCSELRVLDGDYTVHNQEDLDGMVYTEITGTVTINAPDIENIENFSCLVSVGGDLRILNNAALTNLDGMSNLTSIGGALSVTENAALTTLDGMSSLPSVSDHLHIRNNTALINLNGLSGISSLGGPLTIDNNDALTDLDGLSNISFVVGPLSISENDALTDLDGLSAISSVNHYLSIYSNDVLTNLDGLCGITFVDGFLDINYNNALTDLDGLCGLTSVSGYVHIISNDTLTDLDGLSNITSIGGSLRIENNHLLTSLNGLRSIQSLSSIYITNNTALTNLDGLNGIITIDESIVIATNEALTNLDGLSGTITIGESIAIATNAALTNLDGLSGIISIGGTLGITNNQLLASMTGVSNLSALGGDYSVEENIVLPTCQAQNISDDLVNNHDYTGTINIWGNDDTGTCP